MNAAAPLATNAGPHAVRFAVRLATIVGLHAVRLATNAVRHVMIGDPCVGIAEPCGDNRDEARRSAPLLQRSPGPRLLLAHHCPHVRSVRPSPPRGAAAPPSAGNGSGPPGRARKRISQRSYSSGA